MDHTLAPAPLFKIRWDNRPTNPTLYNMGRVMMTLFCKKNGLPVPHITAIPYGRSMHCGYFSWGHGSHYIAINVERCSAPVYNPTGRMQGFPGNKTDRTPLGVTCHEVGHYADFFTGHKLSRLFASIGRRESTITSYDTLKHPEERLAESFRLFMLNPQLLQIGRPLAFEILSNRFEPPQWYEWQRAFDGTKNPDAFIGWCESWIKR